jgi:hypothetical protein
LCFLQQHRTLWIVKPYTQAGVEPWIFCSGGGRDDHCATYILSKQNPYLGIFEGLGIDNVCMFCGHLDYFTTIWCVSCQFGIFCGHLVKFSPFWYVVQGKIWQPVENLFDVVSKEETDVSTFNFFIVFMLNLEYQKRGLWYLNP